MKTPEQEAIAMGATHFELTPNGLSVAAYYKKEGEDWFYLSRPLFHPPGTHKWVECCEPTYSTFANKLAYKIEGP